jgi:hypothetical protein
VMCSVWDTTNTSTVYESAEPLAVCHLFHWKLVCDSFSSLTSVSCLFPTQASNSRFRIVNLLDIRFKIFCIFMHFLSFSFLINNIGCAYLCKPAILILEKVMRNQ